MSPSYFLDLPRGVGSKMKDYMSRLKCSCIARVLAVSLIFGVALTPRSSHAVLSLTIPGMGALVAMGMPIAVFGSISLVVGATHAYQYHRGVNQVAMGGYSALFRETTNIVSTEGWAVPLGCGIAAVVVGVVIMPQYDAVARITRINESQRQILGLTFQEVQSFNADVNRINMIASQIQAELARPDVTYTESKAIEYSAAVWARYAQSFSPNTLEVIRKIRDYTFAPAQTVAGGIR